MSRIETVLTTAVALVQIDRWRSFMPGVYGHQTRPLASAARRLGGEMGALPE